MPPKSPLAPVTAVTSDQREKAIDNAIAQIDRLLASEAA